MIYPRLFTLGRAGARGKWRAGWLDSAFRRPEIGFQAFHLPFSIATFAIYDHNCEYKMCVKLKNFVGLV